MKPIFLVILCGLWIAFFLFYFFRTKKLFYIYNIISPLIILILYLPIVHVSLHVRTLATIIIIGINLLFLIMFTYECGKKN